MITVTGTAHLKVPYSVDLNMTESEWDALSEYKQDEILDTSIDWADAVRSADVDEFDVDEVEEEESA